jgi:hypothetical protein
VPSCPAYFENFLWNTFVGCATAVRYHNTIILLFLLKGWAGWAVGHFNDLLNELAYFSGQPWNLGWAGVGIY